MIRWSPTIMAIALATVCLKPLDWAAQEAARRERLRELQRALNTRKDLH